MIRIYEEYQRKEIGYRLVCKGELLKLVTYLARNDAVEMLSEEDVLKRRKKLERLNTVYQYIEKHYTEVITNSELAELVHLSEGRFCHIFKESAGVGPLQYINEIRLNKAMNLLRKGVLRQQRRRRRWVFRIIIISGGCSAGILGVRRWKHGKINCQRGK